jgi:hypothetical protein
MAQQITTPTPLIPLNDLPGEARPESISLSNPQISTPQTLSGSSNHLNGVIGGTFKDRGVYDFSHPGFCDHWRPPGLNATNDISTVE